MTDPQQQSTDSNRHELPSGLIHDLRTPLNQIIGYSEMLIERTTEAQLEGLVPDLKRIRTAGQQLAALIDKNFEPVSESAKPKSVSLPSMEALAPLDQKGLADTFREDTAPGWAQGVVLVVDDIEANRDVLSRLLQHQGYTVAMAENGRQALGMLTKDTFDLVLLDIMMPEMDGYEVLQRLKADDHLNHIPVIMISALSEMDSVARCIEMGAEDYLPKPFNPTLLKARITACLEKKRAHDRETNLYEQLQQNYKKLQELEGVRDDLTHMIIHDLRTPLTSVISGMQTLKVIGDLNPDQQQVAEIAVGGGETLLGMIDDLLDVEKLESGSMNLDYILLSVDELVASAVRQVSSLAEGKQLTIARDIPSDLSPIEGDEDKLRRTLVNLLGNAIKFTPPGGSITITARELEGGGSVEFAVVDTGEGIPSDSFGRIFEKFGQVQSRKSGRTMSTGLGLTFCKLAIESHGGQIRVESVPGHGSKFAFTIPVKSVEHTNNIKVL